MQQKSFIHRAHAEWQVVVQMADGAAELQDAVVKLCCLWWQKELPGKADMVPQMIPYLLYQATVSGMHGKEGSCACASELFFMHTESLVAVCLHSTNNTHLLSMDPSLLGVGQASAQLICFNTDATATV